MTEPLSQIGRVKKAHGLHGELKVHIETIYLEDFLSATVLYLGDEHRQMPYFLEKSRSIPNPIIKLEEVDSREEAELLSQPYIFLPTASLVYDPTEYIQETFQFAHLKGISVCNPAGEILGVIDRLESFPQQEMGILLRDGQEILIPLNEAFILSVDQEAGKAIMDFPAGLLDLWAQ